MLAFYSILFFPELFFYCFSKYNSLLSVSQSHRLSYSLSVSLSVCISLYLTCLIPILSVCILQAITLLAQTKQQIWKPKMKLVGTTQCVRKF
jgi:hypothetical protein